MIFSKKYCLIAVLSILSIVSGCASVSKSECIEGDWTAIGEADGNLGFLPGQRLAQHTKACGKHGYTPDKKLYMSGHAAGVRSYCEPDNGYSVGNSGSDYMGVCPANMKTAFLAQYVAGLKGKLDSLRRDEYRLESDLLQDSRDYERAVDNHKTAKVIKRARNQLDSTRSRIRTVRDEKFKIENLILKWRT